MMWEALAIEQAQIIEKLSKLCDDLIAQLAQYKNVDEEERRLRELEGDK